jgi:hypothetical protein
MITNYAELKAAISNWTNKTNLSDANLSDFIRLAESDITRDLRLRQIEKTVTGTAVNGEIPIPADLYQIQYISVNAGGAAPYLEYVAPDQLNTLRNTSGINYYWSDNQKIKTLSPALDYTLFYIPKVPALSTGSPTNFLLTDNPNMYLFSSLHYASIWLKNKSSAIDYGMKYQESLSKMKAESERRRFPMGVPLQVRIKK